MLKHCQTHQGITTFKLTDPWCIFCDSNLLPAPRPPAPPQYFDLKDRGSLETTEVLRTFAQRFRFYDLTYAPGSHSILCSESELVPSPTLQVFQAVGAFAGADGKTPPLLTVVLGVLQYISFRKQEAVTGTLLAFPRMFALCAGWVLRTVYLQKRIIALQDTESRLGEVLWRHIDYEIFRLHQMLQWWERWRV